MHYFIEDTLTDKLPSYYRDIFKRVDFSFLKKINTLNPRAHEPKTEDNVDRLFYNILNYIRFGGRNGEAGDIIGEEQLEEVYDYISNSPEIRVMGLPISSIQYDENFRRTYSAMSLRSKFYYRDYQQKDKILLYNISINNGELFYRFAIDRSGIIVKYEYI